VHNLTQNFHSNDDCSSATAQNEKCDNYWNTDWTIPSIHMYHPILQTLRVKAIYDNNSDKLPIHDNIILDPSAAAQRSLLQCLLQKHRRYSCLFFLLYHCSKFVHSHHNHNYWYGWTAQEEEGAKGKNLRKTNNQKVKLDLTRLK